MLEIGEVCDSFYEPLVNQIMEIKPIEDESPYKFIRFVESSYLANCIVQPLQKELKLAQIVHSEFRKEEDAKIKLKKDAIIKKDIVRKTFGEA